MWISLVQSPQARGLSLGIWNSMRLSDEHLQDSSGAKAGLVAQYLVNDQLMDGKMHCFFRGCLYQPHG